MVAMPVAAGDSGAAALESLCESLSSPTFKHSVGARDAEIAFIAELMNNTINQSLMKIHDILENNQAEPVSCDNIENMQEILGDLEEPSKRNQRARELRDILYNPHFQALIEAHDDVAAKNYEMFPDMVVPNFAPPPQVMQTEPTQNAIRMVGIRKSPDEPLGITVRKEQQDLVIARIMAGSMIERQGLLHVGDIIKEINGQEVMNPDHLQELMKKSSGSVTLKILPSFFDTNKLNEVFLRAHFTYEPRKDNLIPCRDAGLAFKEGDILELLNMDDANWWQAKKVDDQASPSGLIPSQALEERRKAFVRPEYDYTHKSLLCGIMTKKKKKMMYHSKMNTDLDRHDLLIYEEVGQMPPFQRQVLVLIGAQGVGRRTLKNRLIKANPKSFGTVVPHTSRPIRQGEVDGDGYYFYTREEMEEDIVNNCFLEYGEYDGNMYGTKFQSIVKVVESGKMCVLDINPQALKVIKTSAFMPFVVFIAAAPVEIMRNMHELARQRYKTGKIRTEKDFRNTYEESTGIERRYKNYFDLTIVNDNMDETYNKLRRAIEKLNTEPQWVPVSWVY